MKSKSSGLEARDVRVHRAGLRLAGLGTRVNTQQLYLSLSSALFTSQILTSAQKCNPASHGHCSPLNSDFS